MTSQTIPVEPFDFVAFGATGDLAERKLLPALYFRQLAGQFSEPTRIIGASRTKMDSAGYREFAEKALRDHVKEDELDEDALKTFLERLEYVAVDARSGEGFDAIKALVDGDERIRVFYLAVGPELFGSIAKNLGEQGLITPLSRIVVEKPIGRSLDSALQLNDEIGRIA